MTPSEHLNCIRDALRTEESDTPLGQPSLASNSLSSSATVRNGITKASSAC